MKKWTTTGPSTCGVSLQQILDTRKSPLNDIECWALIEQLCITVKENICNHIVTTTRSTPYVHLPHFIVTPRTVRCTRLGRILLLPYPSNVEPGFEDIHLEYTKMSSLFSTLHNDSAANHMIGLGIRSMAKTLLMCLSSNKTQNQRDILQQSKSSESNSLSNFLSNLLLTSQNISIQDLQERVAKIWASIVGKTPTSQFVSQLCKVTMGWNNSLARQNRIYSTIGLQRNSSTVTTRTHNHLSGNTVDDHQKKSEEAIVSQVINQSASIKFLNDLMNEDGTNEKSITPLCTSSPTKNKNIPTSSLPDLSNNNIYIDLNAMECNKLSGKQPSKEEAASIVNDNENKCEEAVMLENKEIITKDAHDIISNQEKGKYGRRLDYRPAGCVTRSIGGIQKTVTTIHHHGSMSSTSSFSSTSSNSHNDQFNTPSHAKTIQSQKIKHLPSVTFGETNINKDVGLKMVASKLSEECDNINERCTKKRKCVQRNPSRLYRVVKPLTEVTSIPSPATRRCVGPEFVVMSSELEAVRLDLCIRNTKRDAAMGVGKEVEIIMLNGQKFIVQVNPSSITAGEILESILREQDINESAMFTISHLQDGEYMPLANDIRLSKVAPPGWKESNAVASRPLRSGNGSNLLFRQEKVFTLFQRFKFWPSDIDHNLKDSKNKHQLYLQMRRDLLDNRYRMSTAEHFQLAGMALQVEFGDFSEDIHGGNDTYFMLDHYLPQHIIYEIGKQQSKHCLQKVHRAHIGQSQSKTELKFCRQIQQLDVYGFHIFTVGIDKAYSRIGSTDTAFMPHTKNNNSILLGVHVEGIFLFEIGSNKDISKPHKMTESYFWHKVERIQYDKTKFQLQIQDATHDNFQNFDDVNEKTIKKLKFYVSENKAKFLFDLASAHHQYSNRQKLRDNQRIEIAAPTPSTASQQNSMENNLLLKSTDIQYKEPQSSIRSLRSRFFLSRRNISQRKLYTNTNSTTRPRARSQSRDRESITNRCRRLSGRLISNGKETPQKTNESEMLKSSGMNSQKRKGGYMVKRLTHYTSMADALLNPKTPTTSRHGRDENELDTSDKENATPNNRYR